MASERMVRASFSTVGALAHRMPSMLGVVSVPRQHGWSRRPLAEIVTRVRGVVIRAVTANDVLTAQSAVALKSTLEDVGAGLGREQALLEACKAWCVVNRKDPNALQALCQNTAAPVDAPVASLVIESSAGFGEMNRSRVIGALAKRVLECGAAIADPDAASHLLQAAKQLPWEATGHEAIAEAVVALDKDLFYEVDAPVRDRFERALGVSVEEVLNQYANHQRFAVVEVVARSCERQSVLQTIAERAEAAFTVEPRLGYRLVAALASNQHAGRDVLQPFTRPEMWTKGAEESKALAALLERVAGATQQAPSNDSAPALAP